MALPKFATENFIPYYEAMYLQFLQLLFLNSVSNSRIVFNFCKRCNVRADQTHEISATTFHQILASNHHFFQLSFEQMATCAGVG